MELSMDTLSPNRYTDWFLIAQLMRILTNVEFSWSLNVQTGELNVKSLNDAMWVVEYSDGTQKPINKSINPEEFMRKRVMDGSEHVVGS